jgi:hypothetical protein
MKKFNRAFGLLLAVLAFCSGCAIAQQGAMIQAQSAMAKGKYESALGHLTDAESFTKPTPDRAARIALLKGECYENLNKPEEAKAMYEFVAGQYPKTPDGYVAKEKLNPDPLLLEIVAAEDYLTAQYNLGLLPGDNKNMHGVLQAHITFPLPEVKYPFSWSFSIALKGQGSLTNNYTVGRANKDSTWQLQRAWQTGPKGHAVQEWIIQ